MPRLSRIAVDTVAPEQLHAALSLTYGLYQLTQVVGPLLGGLLIAGFEIGVPYAVDAASASGTSSPAASRR